MEALREPPTLSPPVEAYISADEFLIVADSPAYSDRLVELIKGEITTVSYTNRQHSEILSLLSAQLVGFVYGRGLGRVYSGDAGFVLERRHDSRDTVRAVDIAYIAAARAPDPTIASVIEGAPDLAVEILSPRNLATDIDLKIDQLLNAGARAIWIVHPKTRKILVHTALEIREFREGDVLSGGDILPGFSIKLADIFPA